MVLNRNAIFGLAPEWTLETQFSLGTLSEQSYHRRYLTFPKDVGRQGALLCHF